MRKRYLWGIALLASSARGQSVAGRITARSDQDLITALVAAEDSRDSSLASGDPRRHGLASPNSFIRAFTVRGLGRLERAGLMPLVMPAIDDSTPEVRAAAADALAQASARDGAADARGQITRRLGVEHDAMVRGALLEAIGRLAQGTAEQAGTTASLIAPSLAANSAIERRGAIRGLFFLSRKAEARRAGVIPTEITDRAFAMLTTSNAVVLAADDRVNLATILVNTLAMTDSRIVVLSSHADPYVRDRAVGALQRATDSALVRSTILRAMSDAAPIVRFRAVGVFARRLRATDGCAPLIRLVRDRNLTVALAATDALSGCKDDPLAVRLLDSIADRFRDGDVWHLQAHAFVSLAVVDPARAHARMPIFAQSTSLFVRMYADTAARLMGDTIALYRLARDPEPNVRSSAIAGLSKLVGHAADSIYIAALASDDNQLLMAVSAALKGSKTPGAVEAAMGAWDRLRRSDRATVRDGRSAVLALGVELGGVVGDVGEYARYTAPIPTFADLAAIEQTDATIEMADGSVIKFRLHPFDAPTNSARFVRLAKAGTFDGLTFHRIAPFFVVQGPSPNANEYSAPDGPFTRDELGLENRRGTIGLSTRGRDTGDGQIYINTVDNTYLDHEYTVMGTITSGLEAFDRMQEGARIKRITISNNQLRR